MNTKQTSFITRKKKKKKEKELCVEDNSSEGKRNIVCETCENVCFFTQYVKKKIR